MVSKLKFTFYFLFWSIVTGLMLWGLTILYNPTFFPIRNVAIQCNPMIIDQSPLVEMITPELRKGFFGARILKIRNILQGLPEIAFAKVHRVWPDELIIQITLEQAVARWNHNSFLNQYGEIFHSQASSFTDLDLPGLSGSQDQNIKLLDYYKQMSDIMLPLGLKIEAISLNPDQDWHVQLKNGMKLKLGQRDIMDKLRRFVATYHKVFRSSRRASEIDLRYTRGMAIKWSR